MFIKTEIAKELKQEIFKQNLQKEINPFFDVGDMKSNVDDNINKMMVMWYTDEDIDVDKCRLVRTLSLDLLEVLTAEEQNRKPDLRGEFAYGLLLKQETAELKVRNALSSVSGESQEMFTLLRTLKEDSYIVGGFVRDTVTDRKANDIDICTSVSYDALKQLFNSAGWKTKDTGKQFLVLNVKHPKTSEAWEIAGLRKDKDNSKGEPGTIVEDAQRRDFGNSALYYSLKEERLLDPNGTGLAEALNNEIKFVGNAKDRLLEDPLRGWRFYKFIKRGWVPNSKSLKAVREQWKMVYEASNAERVRRELESIVGL